MFRLNAYNVTGSVQFEQVFKEFSTLNVKEKELRTSGLVTVITPMTVSEIETMKVQLVDKLAYEKTIQLANERMN